MMEVLGHLVEIWEQQDELLAGSCGTQTAALGFGGYMLLSSIYSSN
jgi:hypothetical protein